MLQVLSSSVIQTLVLNTNNAGDEGAELLARSIAGESKSPYHNFSTQTHIHTQNTHTHTYIHIHTHIHNKHVPYKKYSTAP
jgi:hypothetical protein